MFAMFVLGSIVIIITGLALYAQAWGLGHGLDGVVRLGVHPLR